MTHTLFTIDETGETFLWKDCEVLGCPNQVCLGLSGKFCWPHTMNGGGNGLKKRTKELVEAALEAD